MELVELRLVWRCARHGGVEGLWLRWILSLVGGWVGVELVKFEVEVGPVWCW